MKVSRNLHPARGQQRRTDQISDGSSWKKYTFWFCKITNLLPKRKDVIVGSRIRTVYNKSAVWVYMIVMILHPRSKPRAKLGEECCRPSVAEVLQQAAYEAPPSSQHPKVEEYSIAQYSCAFKLMHLHEQWYCMWCIELAYLAVRIKHFLEKRGGKQNNAGFTLPGVSKLSARFFMRVLSQVRTEGYHDLPHWKLRDGQFLL